MTTPGEGPREGRRLFGPGIDADVDRELRAHLEFRAQELVDEGWDPGAAREEAARLFGDMDRVTRDCRAIAEAQARAKRRAGMWSGLLQDLRYGMRTLVRAPEFALVATLTLGLGVGANTAIFSVVDGVLLEPLPYDDPGAVVWARERNTQGGAMAVAWENFRDWREQARSFSALAAYGSWDRTVLGAGEPVRAAVAQVTDGFWATFRARAVEGRLTDAADHEPGAEPVAVVGEAFWRSRMGEAPLQDRFLDLGGLRVRVVGVVGGGFDFPDASEIWVRVPEESQSDSRSAHNFDVVGRLAPGVSLETAAAELDALTLRLVNGDDEDPDFLATGAVVMTLHERLVGGSRRGLLLLLAAAGMVLLVACTNLASTLLARGATRARELSVRASLGAPRGRLVRQLLTENGLLALAGTVVGVGVAALVLRGVRALGPASVPRLDAVGIDGTVLAYAAASAMATVLLFGVLPARRLARADVGSALRAGGRGSSGSGRSRVWRLLVAGEVALALVLLTGSTLVVRSFRNLLAEDAGFSGDDVVTLQFSLSQARFTTPVEYTEWNRNFIQEVDALPGVGAAGFITVLPVQGFLPNGSLELDGDLDKLATGGYVLTDGGALEALDVALLRGRLFDDRDGPDAPLVAIVSRSFADEYWPGEDPLGRSVTSGGMDEFWETRAFAEVVGVVEDVRFRALGSEPVPTVYFPYRQRPGRAQWGGNLVVEADGGDAALLVGPLRETLRRMDPDVPPRFVLMRDRVEASVAPQRFTMLLLGGFAALALVLAGAGIYGVVSYQVAERTREMGIRLALGGAPAAVRGMVVRQSLGVVAAGVVVGVAGVILSGRLVRALLYGLAPTDPLSVATAAALLLTAALAASWIPAARGTRVDPMITMRGE